MKGKDLLEGLKSASGPVTLVVQRPKIRKVRVTWDIFWLICCFFECLFCLVLLKKWFLFLDFVLFE